jgi:hypothetical protein
MSSKLVADTDVSDKHTVLLLQDSSEEDGDNVSTKLLFLYTDSHGFTTQESNTVIFTAMRSQVIDFLYFSPFFQE